MTRYQKTLIQRYIHLQFKSKTNRGGTKDTRIWENMREKVRCEVLTLIDLRSLLDKDRENLFSDFKSALSNCPETALGN